MTKYLFFKEDGKVDGKTIYKAGETYEICNDLGSADRWIKRGAIEAERGYDPGKLDDKVIDPSAGEIINEDPDADAAAIEAALEGTEESEVVNAGPVIIKAPVVANKGSKKENKKDK